MRCVSWKKNEVWGASWKKDVGIDFWHENKILEIPTPSRLLWFTVSTATTSTNLWVFSARSGFPPLLVFQQRSYMTVSQRTWKCREITLFFTQDQKKKNPGCVIATLAHWSMSLVLRCPARGLACTRNHSSRTFRRALPPPWLLRIITPPNSKLFHPLQKFSLNLHRLLCTPKLVFVRRTHNYRFGW